MNMVGPAGVALQDRMMVRKVMKDIAVPATDFRVWAEVVAGNHTYLKTCFSPEHLEGEANEEEIEKIVKRMSQVKAVKHFVGHLRKLIINSLWPESFQTLISVKGLWKREFHVDRIAAMKSNALNMFSMYRMFLKMYSFM